MKKMLIMVSLLMFLATVALAFIDDIKILTKDEIAKLTNEQLLDTYTAAKVESNASKTFHTNAGFGNPKEYDKYKDLLTYIVNLRLEMQKRGIDAPPIDEWLR